MPKFEEARVFLVELSAEQQTRAEELVARFEGGDPTLKTYTLRDLEWRFGVDGEPPKMEVLSAVHGIAPRSRTLHKLCTDFERGRVSRTAIDECIEQETTDWLQLQANCGIHLRENGKLRWQDHLRPIVKATTGFAEGIDDAPAARWFGEQRFYRQPTIKNELVFQPEQFQTEVKEVCRNISLVAPSTFDQLVASIDLDDLTKSAQIDSLYDQLIGWLGTAGVERVVFEEYVSEPDNILKAGRSLGRIVHLAALHPELQITYLQYGNGTKSKPLQPPTNLSSEFSNGNLEHSMRIHPYYPSVAGSEIWQLPVDATSARREDFEVETWPLEALRYRTPARIVLTHQYDLGLLPLSQAQQKVKQLGELAARLQAYLDAEL